MFVPRLFSYWFSDAWRFGHKLFLSGASSYNFQNIQPELERMLRPRKSFGDGFCSHWNWNCFRNFHINFFTPIFWRNWFPLTVKTVCRLCRGREKRSPGQCSKNHLVSQKESRLHSLALLIFFGRNWSYRSEKDKFWRGGHRRECRRKRGLEGG